MGQPLPAASSVFLGHERAAGHVPREDRGRPDDRVRGSRLNRAASRLDGERSRERILDAAERLLAERGFSGRGIAAISRESVLPASSLYWFFTSKQDLAIAVIERAADRWLHSFETPDGDPSLRGFFARASRNRAPVCPISCVSRY